MKSLRANKQKFWSRKFIRTGRAWVGSIQGEEVV
jgi:hypothetical protein